MVQIIGRPERSPDAGDSFAQAIMGFSQMNEDRKMKEQQAKDLAGENKAIKEQFGLDLTNIKDPEARKIFMQGEMQRRNVGSKLSGEEAEKTKAKETSQKAFNRLGELIPKVGRGSGVMSAFGGKTAEYTGEFNTLLGAMEARLKDMVNKGSMTNARFDYIKNDLLPKSTDTQATIRGKMKGLALELDLDPSALEPKKKGKKDKSASETQEKQSLKDIWE